MAAMHLKSRKNKSIKGSKLRAAKKRRYSKEEFSRHGDALVESKVRGIGF